MDRPLVPIANTNNHEKEPVFQNHPSTRTAGKSAFSADLSPWHMASWCLPCQEEASLRHLSRFAGDLPWESSSLSSITISAFLRPARSSFRGFMSFFSKESSLAGRSAYRLVSWTTCSPYDKRPDKVPRIPEEGDFTRIIPIWSWQKAIPSR